MRYGTVPGDGTAPQSPSENPWASSVQEFQQVVGSIDHLTAQQARLVASGDVEFSLRPEGIQSVASETLVEAHCPSPDQSIHSFELNLTPSSSESDLPSLSRGSVRSSTMSTITRMNPAPKPANMYPTFNINHHPPFQDPMETLGTQPYDVVKIRNVPFAVTVAEIKAFVNRLTTSPLIKDHQQGYPVHIIMERSTGKTMDCFVEFQHKGAALAAVRRAEDTTFEGKIIKMGSRRVDVDLSSEGELCAALFPRAKSVYWDKETGIPTPMVNQDPFSEGFQGFFTVEEISSICKHASNPQKSTFMQRCQQRVYESMISTLYKFPWHVPKHYTLNARNFLWSAYMELLRNLMARVQPDSDHQTYGTNNKEVGLSHGLLLEFVFAGLNVQMFSLRQKFMIVHSSGSLGSGFPLPKQAMSWPFHTLMQNQNYSPDAIDEWLNILDTGYQRCLVHRISHGYESYLELSRDDSNFLQIELNDFGRELPFHDLISVEKGLMEVLVENGRQEYCFGYGLPYKALNMWGRSSPVKELPAVETSMGLLQLSRIEDRNYDDASDTESDGLGPLTINSQYKSPSEQDGETKQDLKELFDNDFPFQTPDSNRFNPATPSFIPSQPWVGANRGDARADFVSMNTSEYSGSSDRGLSFALAPSWTSPQELPSSRNSGRHHPTPSTMNHDASGGTTRYDPFHSSASPQAPRRTSLQSRRSSASGSPAGSDGLDRAISATEHDEPRQRPVRTKLVHALPPKPVFGNIWGPTVLRAAYTPKSSTPANHALPVDAGRNTEPSHIGRDGTGSTQRHPSEHFDSFGSDTLPLQNAQSTAAYVSSISGVNRPQSDGAEAIKKQYTSAAAKLTVAKNAGRQEKAGPWTRGSPSHGSKSRSSSSRNFVQIQATIHEEGDLSAADTADGIDDAGTDTGGVSLENWN